MWRRRQSVVPIKAFIGACTKCTSQGVRLHYAALCCGVLWCTALYSSVSFCTLLYCTKLYCTIVRCTILHCIAVFCTVLYSSISCTFYFPFNHSLPSLHILLPVSFPGPPPFHIPPFLYPLSHHPSLSLDLCPLIAGASILHSTVHEGLQENTA
jgi:hypothetical protein